MCRASMVHNMHITHGEINTKLCILYKLLIVMAKLSTPPFVFRGLMQISFHSVEHPSNFEGISPPPAYSPGRVLVSRFLGL
jgi:hypothetical protein